MACSLRKVGLDLRSHYKCDAADGVSLDNDYMMKKDSEVKIITRKDKNALFVICYDSLLKISFVEDQNGESLINQLKEGDRFYTTSKELDNAKSSKFLKNKNSIKKYDKNSDID